MSEMTTKKLDIQMIAVDKIVPNPWNPNEMSDEAFLEYTAEVERLGGLPKPVVVRRLRNKYQIVDGEHAWRAACEVGFTEVPCEVVEFDDFEAMRQTHCRNRGGKDNPLKLGEMLARMRKERKLSIRKLASEMELADGTVRNHLDYVRAFNLRVAHAPESARDDIETLKHRQVRQYLELPSEIGDKWLDAGADTIDLDFVCKNFVYEAGNMIVAAGLADTLEATTWGFSKSFETALELSRWREEHSAIRNINAYLPPLTKSDLPAWLLDELPCVTSNGSTRACISPKEWASILKNASAHSTSNADKRLAVQSGVRQILRKKKVDPAEVYGPQTAELLQWLEEEAPDFIREADWLNLEEQYHLATLKTDATVEATLRAKELACQVLHEQRADGKPRRRGTSELDAIRRVFFACLHRVQGEEALAQEDGLFADPDMLQETVLATLTETEIIREGVINGRPAAEVLTERLDALEWPEFFLLATSVLHTDALDIAARRWLEAMDGHELQDVETEQQEEAEDDDNDDDHADVYDEGDVESEEYEEEENEEDDQEGYEEEQDEEVDHDDEEQQDD